MYTLLSSIPVRQTDSNGAVVSGALLYTYAAGTTTPQATYTDGTGSTPLSNPVVADATGIFPAIWTGGLTYDFACYTPGGTLIWEVRSYTGQQTTGSAAWLTVTGTDTIAGSISPGFPAYTTGKLFQFAAAGANVTTTVNLNINGLGPVSILRKGGGAIAAGDVVGLVQVYYNGTYFEYINSAHALKADSAPWSGITGTPTTSSGYGITDVAGAATTNLITNPVFNVNQRGYVSGTATGSASQPTLDRWRVITSGQSLAFAASGAGNIATAPAGGIEQLIEGASIRGGTYTIAWTGAATCTVNGSAATTGSQVTLTAGVNASVKFFSGTVSEVMLVPGSATGTFVLRDAQTELAMCQREYVDSTTCGGLEFIGYCSSGSVNSASINFPVAMRVTPTVTGTSTSAFGFPAATGGLTASKAQIHENRVANSTQVPSVFSSNWTASTGW